MASVSFFFLTIAFLEYLKGANATAIISSYPLWFFGLISFIPAVLAWLAFHSKWGCAICCTWAIFIISTNDHLPVLSRINKQNNKKIAILPRFNQHLVTLNCSCLESLDTNLISSLNPSILFLQQINDTLDIEAFASALFGDKVIIKRIGRCAIITNGGQVTPKDDIDSIPFLDGLIVDWKPENSLTAIRLVNISLEETTPFKSMFTPSSWKYYSEKRYIHRIQIQNLFEKLKHLDSQKGELPTVIAGNFAVQEKSPIFKELHENFSDPYKQCSTKYGATFPANMPLFRMDRVFGCSLINFHTSDVVYMENGSNKAISTQFSIF